jgi:hypothetical protein
MKSLLEKEIKWADIKTALVDVGPFGVFMSLFKKKEKEVPQTYRTVSPSFKIAPNAEFFDGVERIGGTAGEAGIAGTSGAAGTAGTGGTFGVSSDSKILKVQRNLTGFKRAYGGTTGVALDMVKRALVADLIEEAVKRKAVTFRPYTKINEFGVEEHFMEANVKIFEK